MGKWKKLEWSGFERMGGGKSLMDKTILSICFAMKGNTEMEW